MLNPLVSVVIPTYNGEKTIRRAIGTVLSQTMPDFELIVVDDASKDGTADIVKSINDERIIFIPHSINKGGSAARNTGIRYSKGKFIAFLDDDDEWMKEKLEKQLDVLSQINNEEYGGVCCPILNECDILDGTGAHHQTKSTGKSIEGDLREIILMMGYTHLFQTGLCINPGTTLLLKRGAVESIGFFDESFIRHQDLEYPMRVLRRYKIAVTDEPLAICHGHKKINPTILAETKKKFLDAFSTDIDSMGHRKARRIRAINWLEVSREYSSSGQIKESFIYLKRSLQYDILPPHRYFGVLLFNICSIKEALQTRLISE